VRRLRTGDPASTLSRARAVQGVHRTFFVTDKDVTRVDREPRGARQLTRPDRVAADEIEAPDPPLVGHGAHFALATIGSPTTSVTRSSSVASARHRNGRLPANTPLASAIDSELTSGKPGEQLTRSATMPTGTRTESGGFDRCTASAAAVFRVEGEQATIGAADDHQVPRHEGRREDLA